MNRVNFEQDAYLQRINLRGSIMATADGLEALHRAQLYSIPFENFDILLERGIHLEPSALFNKLVHRPRGGYCFELNGLFLMALQSLGFNARPLLARVHLTGTPSGRGHQLTLVSIRGWEWITDVGFGSQNMRAPLPLERDHPIMRDGQTYRLKASGPFGTMLQALENDRWQDLYSFDRGHVYPSDIAYGNHYTATHPDSFFTFKKVAARHLQNGVYTLSDTTLKSVINGTQQAQELKQGQAYLDALQKYFGIELDASPEALFPNSDTDE